MTRRSRDKKRFGQWLKLIMLTRGLTGVEIAEATGVDNSAVSKWRNGTLLPGEEACEKLAKFLDVDPLRLAVTAGLISEEIARVPPLPPPDDTELAAVERESIADLVSKKISRKRDREALLAALEALSERDNYANAPDGQMQEALHRIDQATQKLLALLEVKDSDQ
ncbi:hypothetical protein C6N75_10100 [Streptomyces solincola]|uniref:HTH cro/C1-type domain-containing protein n=1 Tax=Streptomyces solincola TaxID=2100817 RepID=A0A2S9PYJ3_9ACTN|nr:helix-turn-helix transcriptional regulator [Streptomyces solincola]PRH79423.1 hypothetical protein C6N75_10100 [Streptomyces solincola]